MNDDAKRMILARRARFVAAAVAGLSVASCDSCDSKRATPSDASVTQPTATGGPSGPRVCLSPPRPPDPTNDPPSGSR